MIKIQKVKELKMNVIITFISACGAFLMNGVLMGLFEKKVSGFVEFLGMFFMVLTICAAARVLRLVSLLERL